jgi:Flp pilus assembly protein TadG
MRCSTKKRRGAAAVEFAVVILVLLGLVVGIWEVGQLVHISQIVSNAAREGGRQASTAKYTIDQVRQAVLDYLKNANVRCHPTLDNSQVNLTNTNVTITVTCLDGTDTYNANQFDRFLINVSVPIGNFEWVTNPSFTDTSFQITGSAGYMCVADLPINVSATIPQQPLK